MSKKDTFAADCARATRLMTELKDLHKRRIDAIKS
jgi:hypothetical protein